MPGVILKSEAYEPAASALSLPAPNEVKQKFRVDTRAAHAMA